MWNVGQEKKRAESQKTRAGEPGSKNKVVVCFPCSAFLFPFALLLSSATILFCTTHQHHKERNTAQQYYESLSSDNEKTQFVCADEHY